MKLTNNFSKIEFESRDGSKMPKWVEINIKELAENLQILRDYIGRPIHINSAYRSPAHNARIGGVKNSYHTKGKAADITVKGYTPRKLASVILKLIREGKLEDGGLGLYPGFVHWDIRGKKARWNKTPWYNIF